MIALTISKCDQECDQEKFLVNSYTLSHTDLNTFKLSNSHYR